MQKETWDKVYAKKRFGGTWHPNEGVVRFVARYLKRRVGLEVYDTKRDTKRILDVGCGNGRHVVSLAEDGFDVCGIDISKEAIGIADLWLSKKGLKADLRVGDIEKLPFDDNHFDAVISSEVLDHIGFSKAKQVMDEMRRVLSKGGYTFVSLRSTEDSECGRGKKAGYNTFTLHEGYEKGMLQHYFNLKEIKDLFVGFKIFDIELYEQRFPSAFTVDKAFLQSSKGNKKYLDLSEPIDMDLKYSRWYIAAEKVK